MNGHWSICPHETRRLTDQQEYNMSTCWSTRIQLKVNVSLWFYPSGADIQIFSSLFFCCLNFFFNFKVISGQAYLTILFQKIKKKTELKTSGVSSLHNKIENGSKVYIHINTLYITKKSKVITTSLLVCYVSIFRDTFIYEPCVIVPFIIILTWHGIINSQIYNQNAPTTTVLSYHSFGDVGNDNKNGQCNYCPVETIV